MPKLIATNALNAMLIESLTHEDGRASYGPGRLRVSRVIKRSNAPAVRQPPPTSPHAAEFSRADRK
ncbi:hypothetical protein PCCS19_33840 [Paenibacillus sp. CCS19]|nr:hypothetical protein PCCS19_33840 [Paenibacillus cellulosilyticus]